MTSQYCSALRILLQKQRGSCKFWQTETTGRKGGLTLLLTLKTFSRKVYRAGLIQPLHLQMRKLGPKVAVPAQGHRAASCGAGQRPAVNNEHSFGETRCVPDER